MIYIEPALPTVPSDGVRGHFSGIVWAQCGRQKDEFGQKNGAGECLAREWRGLWRAEAQRARRKSLDLILLYDCSGKSATRQQMLMVKYLVGNKNGNRVATGR
jgi:hypothetical protein